MELKVAELSPTPLLVAPLMLTMAEFGPRTITSLPVPVRVTVCVLPVTALLLSVTTMEPVRVPRKVGVKATSNVQLAATAKAAAQLLFVTAKSPLDVTLAMDNGAVPVFERVTVWATLVVLTS